jgi:hypothetical protein
MKRLLALAALVALSALSVPATARPIPPRVHRGTVCNTLGTGTSVPLYKELCVHVNTRDITLGTQVEALVTAANLSNVDMKIDWIHLYRDGTLTKDAGPTGWMSGSDNSFSTGWANYCGGGVQDFRAVVRARIRKDGATNPGPYETWDSSVVALGGSGVC